VTGMGPYPPFQPDGYVRTVSGLVDRGYQIADFHSVSARSRDLVLRHDIDQSIPLARRMAELEAEQGWRSTWFVLVRTEMYNPWGRGATADLRAIAGAGHEIGLHLDASMYPDDATLEAGCANECAALEAIVDRPVLCVSFHRPPSDAVGNSPPTIAGRKNVYAPGFVSEIGYSSDSRGRWRFGHPWDHPAVAAGHALHLLTHPVWWFGQPGDSMRRRLERVLESRTADIERELSGNNVVWRDG
jgi:hypothetical protein